MGILSGVQTPCCVSPEQWERKGSRLSTGAPGGPSLPQTSVSSAAPAECYAMMDRANVDLVELEEDAV